MSFVRAFFIAVSGFVFRRGGINRLTMGVLCWIAMPVVGLGASIMVSGNSAVNMTHDDGPRNVAIGFFDETSGERIGRLQIGLMTLDYGRQGVFRVAWKPQIILSRVTLQLNDLAACGTVGAQLPEALRSVGATGLLRLREVVLEISRPAAVRIVAQGAEFTPTGDLLLISARRSDDTSEVARNLVLRLRGPEAGVIASAPVRPLPTLDSPQSVTLNHP